jgi:fructose-specific component phosphotransferase system IIB-like protein
VTGVEVRVEGLSKCNDDPEAVLAEAAGTAQPPRAASR